MSMSSLEANLERLQDESMSNYKTRILSQYLLSSISKHRQKIRNRSIGSSPLIVGLQGPQGSGKTTITTSIKGTLSSPPHNLNVAIYSLDDLYLPHSALESLQRSNPGNKLLHGRGQPGTHDLALGTEILTQFTQINSNLSENQDCDPSTKSLNLPIYDKSAYGGKGDRSKETISITTPPRLDLVLFEGWCLGFKPLYKEKLESTYHSAQSEHGSEGHLSRRYFLNHSLENLLEINQNLSKFQQLWYPFLNDFIQLLPESEPEEGELHDPFGLETIFKWRLQAEEEMKTKNGGQGMDQGQVRTFVERYFPSYELFSSTLSNMGKPRQDSGDKDGDEDKDSTWRPDCGLRIVLGSEREVKRVEMF